MEYEQIIYEKVSPHIVYITLNRPEKMNSVTHEMFQSWGKAITEAERDDDVKVIVFRGAGRCFSAGAPLDQVGYVYGMTDPKHGERGLKIPLRVKFDFDRSLFFEFFSKDGSVSPSSLLSRIIVPVTPKISETMPDNVVARGTGFYGNL